MTAAAGGARPSAGRRPCTPGSPAAVERQHAKGKMTARERIDYLLDDGSFQELDMLARHRAHGMGLEDNRPYTDGVVTGFGTIDGRRVCVFSPGLHRLRRRARRGVRREDPQGHGPGHLDRRADDRPQRRRRGPHPGGRGLAALLRRASSSATSRPPGVIPQISVILGPCAGGAVYSPGHDRLHLHGPGHLATCSSPDPTW